MGSALRRRHGPSHQSNLERSTSGQPRFRQNAVTLDLLSGFEGPSRRARSLN
jgi:hypothetical protein